MYTCDVSYQINTENVEQRIWICTFEMELGKLCWELRHGTDVPATHCNTLQHAATRQMWMWYDIWDTCDTLDSMIWWVSVIRVISVNLQDTCFQSLRKPLHNFQMTGGGKRKKKKKKEKQVCVGRNYLFQIKHQTTCRMRAFNRVEGRYDQQAL